MLVAHLVSHSEVHAVCHGACTPVHAGGGNEKAGVETNLSSYQQVSASTVLARAECQRLSQPAESLGTKVSRCGHALLGQLSRLV